MLALWIWPAYWRDLAMASVNEIVGGGGRKLFERCSGGFEDFAHRLGAHALYVAQPLGDVENEALGGFLRQFEIPRGVVTLLLRLHFVLLRNPTLLDRYATLPISKSSKTKSQYQPSGQTARENVSPPRRPLSAAPDERLRLICRCGCAWCGCKGH